MKNLYYIPPTNKQFIELKLKAIEIWNTYDNTYHYVDEKVGRIKDLQNVEDNFMYMVAMFDWQNQQILSHKVSSSTRKAVFDRLIAGGAPEAETWEGGEL